MDFGTIEMSAIEYFLPNHLTLRLAIEQWEKLIEQARQNNESRFTIRNQFFLRYYYVTVIEIERWLLKMMCVFSFIIFFSYPMTFLNWFRTRNEFFDALGVLCVGSYYIGGD